MADTIVEVKTRPEPAAPLCPWREPAKDLQRFFPAATRYVSQTLILSGFRTELTQRLGRMPSGDENALHVFRIYHDEEALGSVLVRRVKGVCGALEMVLAVDAQRRVCGLRLQRWREPESVVRVLVSPAWTGGFLGRGAESAWDLGPDSRLVPEEGRLSAEAIVQGARSLLILLETAERREASPASAVHFH